MMRSMQNSYQRQRGLSLIELMVAMVLAAVLLLGMSNFYVDSKRNYFLDEQAARMQENGRYALALLGREIAMSGYSAGILDLDSAIFGAVDTNKDCGGGGNWVLDPSTPLEFAGNVADGLNTTYSCITNDDTENGTDLLVIKRTADSPTVEDGSVVNGAITNTQWYMRVENNGSDVEIVRGDSATVSSGVDLWQYYAFMFFVRPYSSEVGDDIPALCVEELTNTGMDERCLIEGIEDIQYEFGIDTTGDGAPNEYDPTPDTTQLESLVAVRIHVLVRSINPVTNYTNDKTYIMGAARTVVANDGFLRRLYTSTVKVRNVRKLT